MKRMTFDTPIFTGSIPLYLAWKMLNYSQVFCLIEMRHLFAVLQFPAYSTLWYLRGLFGPVGTYRLLDFESTMGDLTM